MHFAATKHFKTAAVLPLLSAVLLLLHRTSAQTISIIPDTNAATQFEGQEFRRVCSVPGAMGASYEWRRNGDVIESGSGPNLQLRLTSVTLSDTGEYFCHATLSDSTELGPVSGGFLTVLAISDIAAPSQQFIVRGSTSHLNCSYPGATILWYEAAAQGGGLTSAWFFPATLEHEGEYQCEVFLDQSGASVRVTVFLHIIEPVQITNTIPGNQNIEGRSPFSQNVEFTGRDSQDITITWHRDGIPLPASEFSISYPSPTTGRTRVEFPAIMRSHAGVYRVVIESQLGRDHLPTSVTYDEISFQVTVEVPPIMPVDFDDRAVTSFEAWFTWTLTNQTADEGAEELIITVFYSNGTLAVETVVPGDQTQTRVELVPGTQYIATLTAVNPDGLVTTEPISIQTLNGAPLITGVNVTRETDSITVTTSLAYTGGGNITTFDLRYRLLGSDSEWVLLGEFPAYAISELLWFTEVTNPDLLALEESLEFNVSVRNEHRFPSDGRTVILSRPTAATLTTSPPPTSSTLPLPLWLLVLVVVLVTALVTGVVITALGCVCCRCRRREGRHKYNVKHEENQLTADDDLVKRSQQDNLTQSLKNGTLPVISEISSEEGGGGGERVSNEYTPQPHHTRNPSTYSTHSGSSATTLTKPRISPSTTASNSPANFVKGGIIREEREEEGYSSLRDVQLSDTKLIVAQVSIEDGSHSEQQYQNYCNNQQRADSNYSQSECGESERSRETPLPLKQQFITNSGYSSNSSSHQSIPLKYLSPSPAGGNPEVGIVSLPPAASAEAGDNRLPTNFIFV